MVAPGLSSPSFSALATMQNAARSFTEPVGFLSSSLAHSRTSGPGDSRGRPTSGVPPTESSSESYRIRLPPAAWLARPDAGQRIPPATAGSTVTVSPSLTGTLRPPRKRTSSSLR